MEDVGLKWIEQKCSVARVKWGSLDNSLTDMYGGDVNSQRTASMKEGEITSFWEC